MALSSPTAAGFAAAVFLGLTTAGCGGGGDTGKTGLTRVRVINGLIGTAGFVDPSLGGVAFGGRLILGGITGYKGVSPSGQTLRLIRSAEGTATAPATASPLFEQAVPTLERNKSYSLVAAGVAGSGDSATAPELMVLPEADVPAASGPAGPDPANNDTAEASVRLLNLSPDAGAVQLLSGDLPVGSATGVTFGGVSAYTPVTVKNAKLRVRVAAAPGATTFTDIPVGSDAGALALARGRSYTLVLTGLRSPAEGSEALAVTISAEN